MAFESGIEPKKKRMSGKIEATPGMEATLESNKDEAVRKEWQKGAKLQQNSVFGHPEFTRVARNRANPPTVRITEIEKRPLTLATKIKASKTLLSNPRERKHTKNIKVNENQAYNADTELSEHSEASLLTEKHLQELENRKVYPGRPISRPERKAVQKKWNAEAQEVREADRHTKKVAGTVATATHSAMQAERREYEKKKLVLGREIDGTPAVKYKTGVANFTEAESAAEKALAQTPTITVLNSDALVKARAVRENSRARMHTNNVARTEAAAKKKFERASAELSEGMNMFAAENLAEIEAEQQMERMRAESAANEQQPNSKAEEYAKIQALMAKYGQVMNKALDTDPVQIDTPAAQERGSVSSEEALRMGEEAARIYQGGIAFESTPEISKEQMEEAARTFQTGYMEPAAKEVNVDNVASPSATEFIEQGSENVHTATPEAPSIVMLNPILSRQAGLKNVGKLSFGTADGAADLPPRVAELLKQEDEKKRVHSRNKKVGFWRALGLGGAAAAFLAFLSPGDRHTGPHKDTHNVSAPANPSASYDANAHARLNGPQQIEDIKPPVVVVPHRGVEVSIDARGEGADKLYTKLVTKLHAEYPDSAQAPALIQKLFNYRNADAFSQEMGFEKLPKSAVMHMQQSPLSADSIKVSADGKTLVYVDSAKVPFVLMQTSPQGDVYSYQSQNLKMRPLAQNYSVNTKIGTSRYDATKAPSAAAEAPSTSQPANPQPFEEPAQTLDSLR